MIRPVLASSTIPDDPSALDRKILDGLFAEERALRENPQGRPKNVRGVHVKEFAAKIGEAEALVGARLWMLWGQERVERTLSGTWYVKIVLDEVQRTLYNVIKVGPKTMTMSDLADTSKIPRKDLRAALDALEKTGAIRMEEDGWYKTIPL